MTEVLESTRKTARQAKAKTAAMDGAQPEWKALLGCTMGDLERACRTITHLADAIGPDEPEVGQLLDMANEHASEAMAILQHPRPNKAISDAAFHSLMRPRALLLGAAAMIRASQVDLYSESIMRVQGLLDECQNNLDAQALGKLLPTGDAHPTGSEYTPEAIKSAFDGIEALLNEAHGTDEAHDWSGDSDRLLRIAHDLADGALIRTPTDAADVNCAAFDIAALIRAARLVPGDSESPERKALIDQAAVQLNWLTECDKAGSDCCDPGVPRPAAPKTKVQIALTPEPLSPRATFADTALHQTIEAQAVIYACVENYAAPETVWALHTVLEVCVGSLDAKKIAEKGAQEASNLLAQAIALGSFLLEEINGHGWEILLDAALSLMLLAKDTLDKGGESA